MIDAELVLAALTTPEVPGASATEWACGWSIRYVRQGKVLWRRCGTCTGCRLERLVQVCRQAIKESRTRG